MESGRHQYLVSRPNQLALAISLALTITVPLAQAEQPAELEALQVEGDWIGNTDGEVVKAYPGARTLIDSEQLQESGALNIEDALRSTPGIQVLDETGTGILPNIALRGLNPLRSERLQMLVDGYPIAIGPYSNIGVSLFPVTLPSIDSIDIVRGGAAVHYGPNNVGGVMNLHTRAIPLQTEQTLSQRLTIAEATGNLFSDTYYRIGGFATEDLALQFQANIQNGDGAREHSDTEVRNFIFDADYFLNDTNELDLSLQYYDVEAELPGALSPAAFKQDTSQSQRLHDAYDADMVRGTLTWTYTPTSDVELEWRNFAHRADRTFFFGQRLGDPGVSWADPAFDSTHVADSPRVFHVWGTEPRLTMRLPGHTLTLGARYVSEEVDFDVNREELSSGSYANVRQWDSETKATAVYISDTQHFMDGRLEVTEGVRIEDIEMDFHDRISDNRFVNDTTARLPGVTVGFQASDALFLFANAQRSLVPVQIAQVSRGGEVANELAWNQELGARWQIRPELALNTTLFRIDYEDQIQFNKATSLYENLGETRHEGVELSADWQATPQLDLALGYTYLDTEQLTGDNKGNELPNAPHHHASVEGRYRLNQWSANLGVHYVSDSFSDAANTEQETANGDAGKLPAYTLVNARIGRDIVLGQGRMLNLGLAATNLTDEEYYFRGADVSPVGRVPAPGRAFILEGRLDF
ncbi:TonB-dependent siderophore receptor [Marinobacterium sp. D7]|uniref:TonB-dependent receptor family protein n=1 Tax=Marinobacterium ramblicola TaxID=2849041 RepID=UPI001C2D5418|nr:TonB-dependent siderophore receptor [Marinobacterium ramblicola]MBV1789626.1 TonB-dependent siderophore receptor [Marinobacterium ramblicola]